MFTNTIVWYKMYGIWAMVHKFDFVISEIMNKIMVGIQKSFKTFIETKNFSSSLFKVMRWQIFGTMEFWLQTCIGNRWFKRIIYRTVYLSVVRWVSTAVSQPVTVSTAVTAEIAESADVTYQDLVWVGDNRGTLVIIVSTSYYGKFDVLIIVMVSQTELGIFPN